MATGKTKIEFTEDYKFAELPQHGGKITEAKKGDVHEVSLEIAEVIIKQAKKGKRVGEEVKTEDDKTAEVEAAKTEDEDEESLIKKLNPFTKDKNKAESD